MTAEKKRALTEEELRALNPELRRTTTPDRAHDLKVPVGTAATIQTHLETADSLFVHFEFYTGAGDGVRIPTFILLATLVLVNAVWRAAGALAARIDVGNRARRPDKAIGIPSGERER